MFSAHTSEKHLGVGQNIIFDELVTNLGGGFHMSSGLFTAPINGVYMISTTVLTNVDVETRTSIVVNGRRIVSTFGHATQGRHDQGTQVAVLQLNQGDDVSVQNIDIVDASIWGERYTSFSGYLIQPM